MVDRDDGRRSGCICSKKETRWVDDFGRRLISMTALLLAHARMQEGSRGLASSAGDEKRQTTWQIPLPPPVTFNPLFASPSVAGPSRVPKKQVSPQRKSVSRTEISPRGRTEQPAAQTLEQGVRGTSASLEDVVEDFLKSQRNLAGSEAFKPSSSEPNGSVSPLYQAYRVV